jgi:Tc toxin complex TcA C-terminal TcB-binding domain/Neuraminidase-like domain/Putative peptidoglycan binding domain
MKPVISPLTSSNHSADVANLQDALLLLIDKGRIQLSVAEAPTFKNLISQEQHDQTYGGSTTKAVAIFQQQHQLQSTGTVDAPTAEALNQILKELGALDATSDQPPLRIYGMVRDQYGALLDGVTVQAFDRDLRSEEPLGNTLTKAGQYEIRYTQAQFRKAEKDTADVVVKILDVTGKELYKTPIYYNVPDEVEINIVLQGAEYKGPSEFEVLTGLFTPLLDNISPLDLQENDPFQDISFLSGETGQSRLIVGTWAACYRLADKTTREETPLEAAVLYGFMRQGQPSLLYDTLLQDVKDAERVTLLEEKLLQALADIHPDYQQSLLEKALTDNLIPALIQAQIPSILETLRKIKLRFATDITYGAGKGTIGQLLDLIPEVKQAQPAFLAAFVDYNGPMNEFWTQLQKDNVLSPEIAQKVKLTFDVGALTRNYIPLVSVVVNMFQAGKVQHKSDLAKYASEDWISLFKTPGADGKPIGVPDNVDGDTEDAKMEQFAATLGQIFERTYPTTSFAAKLTRAEQSPVTLKTDVVHFIENNPKFHLDTHRVDQYIAENQDALKGITDPNAMVTQLKAVQRIFKLNSTYQVVDALLSRKIDSAQQIYFMGRGQFVTTMSNAGIKTTDAKRLYYKAENAYTMALALFGTYNTAMNGVVPFVAPSLTPDTATQAQIATLPNLQTLFGSLDYCECADCRSVYSPAAYFVDVMHFLGERGTQGTTININKNVQQVLLERRPDLGEIELSCENTNTPLPYIDLVNEILEDVVAPPTPVMLNSAIEADLLPGTIKQTVLDELTAKSVSMSSDALVYAPDIRSQWAIRDSQHAYKIFKTGATLQLLPTKQTFLSAAELLANPAYTNQNAYDTLAQEVFPLNLPFDLWYIQTRAYLNHLGLPQPRLLELFQQTLADNVTLVPGELQIECAWLGIPETARKIITGTLPGKQPWDFWGLAETGNNIPDPENPADPLKNLKGHWINDVLMHVNVLLNRSGLAYTELLQLLSTRYVNPTQSVFIFDTADSNAADCDTSLFTVHNLTEDVLHRTHSFIRLWRTLGCEMWELDVLLPNVSADPTVIDKRITDTVLQDISQMNRLRLRFSFDWYTVYSLYNNIDDTSSFDYGADDAPAVQTLYQRLFRNKLVDAVATFPTSPRQLSGPIADRVPGILAALRIKESDLSLILADLSLTITDTLDWTALSHIYRIPVLAKAMSLSVDNFLRLKRLWGQDPFANPAATLAFVQLVDKVSASDFSILEIDYLLAHHYTPNSGVALEDKTIVALLQALREGLQKISDDIHLKTEETSEAYVKSKLGLLPVLVKDADQVKALAILSDTWQGMPADRNTLIDTYFVDVLDLAEAKTKLAAIAPGLSPADHQTEVNKRFDYVQPALEAFLLQEQKEALLRQKMAEVLQLEVLTASELLTQLHLAGTTNTLLQTLNDTKLLSKNADGSYTFLLDETNFPDIFRALRLLYKNALLISKLNMKPEELAWWLTGTHATDVGWMHPKDFPIDTTTSVSIAQWEAIGDFFLWRTNLPPSDETAFEFLEGILDAGTTPADAITKLAQLTAWEASDITALIAAFHWDAKQELRKSASLLRLADCMQALRRLGVNAARALQWATAEPRNVDAESLKQTVKAKYDLVQWLQVIQPLQDNFREQKRIALVSWLVMHPNQAQGQNWSDTNGLYSYFLIDVEMTACMLTARLKQATASVQLFVQRCLMNLEVDILAKTDLDPKWKQWTWMKYFRVWEANRKVFLYPENWIEPELRDEKSPFFVDLENELMQNDITSDTVEQAYLNYLEKLDKVANLEIRAIYNETLSQEEETLHVFGRTRSSQAPEYYYRQRVNGARWLSWEKVDLEISANHLIAGIHNRRLYLLWPQFLEKADHPTSVNIPSQNTLGFTIPEPTRYWEIRLFWSELKKGKWTPKVLSDSFDTIYQSNTGGDAPQNIEFRTRLMPFIEVRLFDSYDPGTYAPTSMTQFNKIGKQVNYVSSSTIEHIISPPASQYANNLILHTGSTQFFYFSSVEESGKPHSITAHENAFSIPLLQQISPYSTYSVIDSQAQGFANMGSFFVWDTSRTYFVDYNWHIDYSYVSHTRHSQLTSSFQFFVHYHPFVELFIKELNIWGIQGLLNRQIQVSPASVPASPPIFNFADYQPTNNVVKNYQLADGSQSYPVEDIDFTYLGAYAPYNWELFFHVPFFIANKLSTNQRFEEALTWYHYIFDPTNTDTTLANADTPQQKYWITKPFYETTKADYYKQKIENLLLSLAKGDSELRKQVEEWRDNPFNPHLIARMRIVAYQKNVLIKYIQTLIAWGDQLFSRDTIETINEATQLYILADSILGPRPRSIPRKVANPIKTLYQLEQEGIDDFGNVLKQVENLLPTVSSANTMGDDSPDLPRLDVLYFGIPNNDKLLTLWDTVADRLFKIRHCMNIEGVVRQLPLYEPPIDPALLVKATAAGLDIGAVLNDTNAPMPLYRFTFMLQRALELCNEVKVLGNALQTALEKKDAEGLALLRSSHELIMLDVVRRVKAQQIDEAQSTLEGLQESRKVVEERQTYYQGLINDGWSLGENIAFGLSIASTALDSAIAAGYISAGGLKLIPQFLAGSAGFGGTPTISATMGGQQIGDGAEMAVRTLQSIAAAFDKGAALASTVASYERRGDEWDFQKRLAEKELPQIDKQIAAADIRHQIALQELTNHDKQRENAQSEDDYMHTKFTNRELFDWMSNQLSTVYFQSYQLAYDIAKRAERCFRYELGLSDSTYIQFGYWDSLKKGLLSGEKLYYDLKRLESAYYEQNRREYELTKHISLMQLDPIALLKLRQNGECIVQVPETYFDMDYPGHYFRRMKTVRLSIPCIVGPYTTIACTLTLISNQLRKDTTLTSGKYERDTTNEDPRFRDEIAAIQSIATSSAQSDTGMFELNFRDERYLPFEGAGAISTWHIQLNKDFPQFDFSTISDVIIHLNYTAREGGELLKSKAVAEFNQKMNDLALAENKRGLFRVFDLKREYPDKLYKFFHPSSTADDQQIVLENLQERLPYFTRQFSLKKAQHIDVVVLTKDSQTYKVMLSPLGNTEADFLSLVPSTTYQGLHQASKDLTGSEVELGTWTLKVKLDGATDFKSLPTDAIEELFLIINYMVA